MPEDRRIFSDLTVWENLDVATRGAGKNRFTLERVYALFPKLAELRDRQGGFLSGGEQQMLTIARTLMLAGPNAGYLNRLWRAASGAEAPLVNIFTMASG